MSEAGGPPCCCPEVSDEDPPREEGRGIVLLLRGVFLGTSALQRRRNQHHHCHIPTSDSKEDTPIKFSDPLMLIVDPLLSNSTLLPMSVSDDPLDAILNPPAMSEPDVERPRRRPRRHPTPYVAIVPLVPVLAVM